MRNRMAMGAVGLLWVLGLCPAIALALDQDAAVRQASSLARRSQWARADAVLRPVLEQNPGHPGALQIRGRILAGQGDRKSAIRAWQSAYLSVGRLPELSVADKKLLSQLRADLKTNDKPGEKLRSVDARHLLKLVNFTKDMRRRKIEDLYAGVKGLLMRIDPGHRIVRRFLADEIIARARARKRQQVQEAMNAYQQRMNSVNPGNRAGGLRLGGVVAGPDANVGGPGRSHYASNSTFEMQFTNQAMMRWLTQMFWMPGNYVPLVESGYLRFEAETSMVHHAARLTEGRQLRVIAQAAHGVVGLGTNGKHAVLRVEGDQATGPDGQPRRFPPSGDEYMELILQRVDGRYQGFVNRGLIFTGVTDLGDDRIAVTLSAAARATSLHLEPAENILPVQGEQDLGEAALEQARADRLRAAELLAAGKALYGQSKFDQAIGPLSEAAALDPLALEARFLVARCREKTSRRRPACQGYRAYLQSARLVQEGKLKPPEGTAPAKVDPERQAAARASLKKMDWEGRRLAKNLAGYLANLEALEKKVAADPFTLERVQTRLAQVRKFAAP